MPSHRFIKAAEYIEAARQLNEAIQPELQEGKFPWHALTKAAEQLARKEGWEGWRYVTGRAADKKDVPFELWMLHLAVLTTAWVCFLYGAKARDRLSVNMKERTMEFLERFFDLRLAAMEGIFQEWDKKAWDAIVRDVRAKGNKDAHIRFGLWDSLSWWQKLCVRMRGIR